MDDNWLDIFDGPDYEWEGERCPPASEEDIAALATFVGRPLPEDYVSFLRRYDGGVLQYRNQWYIHLWRAGEVPKWSTGYGFTSDCISGAVAIGSNGADEGLVFDIRPERKDGQYPVYSISFIILGWEEATFLAPDFRSLLLKHRHLLDTPALDN